MSASAVTDENIRQAWRTIVDINTPGYRSPSDDPIPGDTQAAEIERLRRENEELRRRMAATAPAPTVTVEVGAKTYRISLRKQEGGKADWLLRGTRKQFPLSFFDDEIRAIFSRPVVDFVRRQLGIEG